MDINENFIETDTALIGGDSGGPTFDLQGNVIGIHSHISDQLHVNSDGNIASFHAAWDAMREGRHDKIHYSQSLDQKERRIRNATVHQRVVLRVNHRPKLNVPATEKGQAEHRRCDRLLKRLSGMAAR